MALEKDNFPLLSRSSGRKKGLLTSSLVSFAFLSHNLNVTTLVLQYRQGQNMFPLILPNREEPLGIKYFYYFCNFIEIIATLLHLHCCILFYRWIFCNEDFDTLRGQFPSNISFDNSQNDLQCSH